ncbi:MAG TPA: CPBP family intramembrane glutamic endopeptidase, partial [Blastocatellia bacterium]|nr:CPBP family intramembrane glutamic endopeptidase [Blastocatellia bacterium]
IILQLLIFAAFSIWVARSEYIDLWAEPKGRLKALMVSAPVLIAMIAFVAPSWRRNVEKREWKIYYFMPRTPGEKALWLGVSLFAGFSEEIVYRGVMFSLLSILLDSPIAAALIVAVVFSFSHFMQGWKSMLVIYAVALGFQAIYYLTGSLFPGMAVHFLYDLTAGMMYSYWGEELGYPIEGVPREKALSSVN